MKEREKLTPEEAVEKFRELDTDPEVSHYEAEEILLGVLSHLGHDEVVKAWDEVKERCGGFWYA